MKNRYEVRGKITSILIVRRNGELHEAIIDTEDLPKVLKYNSWHLVNFGKWNPHKKFYVSGIRKKNGKYQRTMLHHLIIGGKPQQGLMVDHVNGNPKDNRKVNLRVVTNQENQLNRIYLNQNNKSGYPGVSKRGKKYVAQFKLNYKNYYIGTFDTPEEAFFAREEMRSALVQKQKIKKAAATATGL